MSRFGNRRECGDIVYPAYSPLRLGKVIEIVRNSPKDGSAYGQRLRVRWKDGTETLVDGGNVLRIDDLIADHETKLAGHKRRRDEAQEGIRF